MQLGREPPRPLATAPQRLPSMRTKMDRNRDWIEERREDATKRKRGSTRRRSVREKESFFPRPLSFLVFATGKPRIGSRDSCSVSTDDPSTVRCLGVPPPRTRTCTARR
ncbi:hypothetical protein GW17_00009647 [Ensete ventricosum]|nr:hypothetical protein GW17_00009647 [Ensete ventricosum]